MFHQNHEKSSFNADPYVKQQKAQEQDKTHVLYEQSIVSELAKEVLKEQRRNRRWGIFFKLILVIYVAGFFAMYAYENTDVGSFSNQKHTALIEIKGVISTETEANADFIVAGLRKAYENNNTQGIILRIKKLI